MENDSTSSKKENRKVDADKHTEEHEIREDKNNSIYKQDNDKSAYPYKNDADEQHKTQPEYIDRNSESKDKR